MTEDIIGMKEMGLIFEVTDALGIDREEIRVPLEKEDPGGVKRLDSGIIEITVPTTTPLEEWQAILEEELAKLGFQ